MHSLTLCVSRPIPGLAPSHHPHHILLALVPSPHFVQPIWPSSCASTRFFACLFRTVPPDGTQCRQSVALSSFICAHSLSRENLKLLPDLDCFVGTPHNLVQLPLTDVITVLHPWSRPRSAGGWLPKSPTLRQPRPYHQHTPRPSLHCTPSRRTRLVNIVITPAVVC
jgi:hypothetical protein